MTHNNALHTQNPYLSDRISKALVVDDEEDIYFLIGNILKQRDIQAVPAASLSEAFEALKKNPDIDLIFLDNRLPDGQGYQFIGNFKKLTAAPIIMITAYDTSYDRKMAASNGADDFIGKPFTRKEILAVIDKRQPSPG